MAATLTLTACAARQIDTQAFLTLPVEVPRLLVVDQQAGGARVTRRPHQRRLRPADMA